MSVADKGTETKTSLRFSEGSEEAVSKELASFLTLLGPRERQIQGDLARAINAPTADLVGVAPGVEALGPYVENAFKAGAGGGLPRGEQGRILEGLRSEIPNFAELFRQYAFETATQTPSFIDPRFASLLAPEARSTTQPTDAQVAYDIVKGVLDAAAAAAP